MTKSRNEKFIEQIVESSFAHKEDLFSLIKDDEMNATILISFLHDILKSEIPQLENKNEFTRFAMHRILGALCLIAIPAMDNKNINKALQKFREKIYNDVVEILSDNINSANKALEESFLNDTQVYTTTTLH
jgi:hypothetical protein